MAELAQAKRRWLRKRLSEAKIERMLQDKQKMLRHKYAAMGEKPVKVLEN